MPYTNSVRNPQNVLELEERFRSLLTYNPDAICTITREGIFESVNPATVEITGYTCEQINSGLLKKIIQKKDLHKIAYHFKRTLEGLSQNYYLDIKHKNGFIINLVIKNVPIQVQHKIVGIYVIAKDITEQKNIEGELKDSEAKYRLITENMSDVICVLDPNGIVSYASPSHKLMTGYSAEDYIGVTPFQFMHPEDVIDIQNRFNNAIKNKQQFLAENRYKHVNGDWIVVEANVKPALDEFGNVKNVVIMARDITQRRKTEEELQESEKRLRTLIDVLPDGVFFKDGQGRWLEVNCTALELFELGGVPYRGKTDVELAEYTPRKDDLLRCFQTDEQAWEAREMIRVEEVVQDSDGNSLYFDTIKVPIFHSNGERKGMVVIGRDITERKKTEEILRKTDKLSIVSELAAGIAHEIRNPLTSLKGFVQLLKQESDKNNFYYEIMLSELERINSIVSEFLILSKPQYTNYEVKDLIPIITSVVTLLQSEAHKNNIQILTAFAMDHVQINCVESQLKQVFINVLKNAMDAMPSGGDISVHVELDRDEYVCIKFVDQGCGIPANRISKLGEPFYTTKEKGTGLGLMVSYKIIENHLGKMKIASEENKGATVEIQLPMRLLRV